jgi:ketosteroid isomerase-like protein
VVEPSDVDRLRAGYEAFNRGDFAAALEDIAPDVEISDRAELPDPGTYRGLDEALEQFNSVGSEFDDYRVDPQEFIVLANHVLAVNVQSGRGKASGVPVEETVVHVWEIRDGRVLTMRAYSDREQALAAVEAEERSRGDERGAGWSAS